MPSAQPAPVDLAHLARYTGGERTLDEEVLRLFAGQSAELMGELQAVIAARDSKRWHHITHSLKGAARGIGAFPMADVAAAAEALDPAAQTREALAVLASLADEAEAVHRFIEAFLQP